MAVEAATTAAAAITTAAATDTKTHLPRLNRRG
jgi:hypothetical protein